jgi:hypothetical protein
MRMRSRDWDDRVPHSAECADRANPELRVACASLRASRARALHRLVKHGPRVARAHGGADADARTVAVRGRETVTSPAALESSTVSVPRRSEEAGAIEYSPNQFRFRTKSPRMCLERCVLFPFEAKRDAFRWTIRAGWSADFVFFGGHDSSLWRSAGPRGLLLVTVSLSVHCARRLRPMRVFVGRPRGLPAALFQPDRVPALKLGLRQKWLPLLPNATCQRASPERKVGGGAIAWRANRREIAPGERQTLGEFDSVSRWLWCRFPCDSCCLTVCVVHKL